MAGSLQNLDFSDALDLIKRGERVAREHWPQGQHLLAGDTDLLLVNSAANVITWPEFMVDLMAEDWHCL